MISLNSIIKSETGNIKQELNQITKNYFKESIKFEMITNCLDVKTAYNHQRIFLSIFACYQEVDPRM